MFVVYAVHSGVSPLTTAVRLSRTVTTVLHSVDSQAVTLGFLDYLPLKPCPQPEGASSTIPLAPRADPFGLERWRCARGLLGVIKLEPRFGK